MADTKPNLTPARVQRAMLPRGAACDLCRSRKVKCDAQKPVCGNCIKSARGNLDSLNCVYEGPDSVKIPKKTRLLAANNPQAPSTVTQAPNILPRPTTTPTFVPTASTSILQEVPLPHQQVPMFAASKRDRQGESDGALEGAASKRQAGAHQRVDVLNDRISELEQRLREKEETAAAPASQLYTHVRASPSPPFHPAAYSSYQDPSLSTDHARDPHVRRSHSFAESDGRGGEMAAHWTQESNLRSTDPHRHSLAAGYSSNYASFAPPHQQHQQSHQLGHGGYEEIVHAHAVEQQRRESQTSSLENGGGYAQAYSPFNYTPGGELQQAIQPRIGSDQSASSFAESPTDLPIDVSLFQLFYPAWPPSLPQPAILHHLLNVFFSRAIVPSSSINKTRLFDGLNLAPNDEKFPHTSLLHAICAFSCVFCSPEALGYDGDRKKYWESESSPRDYHFKCAREEIDIAVATMQGNLFHVLQAVVICCYIAYASANFTDLWILSGLATRLVTPLGLNHLPPWDHVNNTAGSLSADWKKAGDGGRLNIAVLLGPPKDREEHYERAATFWAVFAIDRHASASTGWSTSIDELDISTQLPCYSPASEASLSIRHPNFLLDYAKPVGSLGQYIKAVVLLGRVINFLQRLPRWQNTSSDKSSSEAKRDIKATPAFMALEYALGKFRTATSANVFDAGDSIDGHLASAYAIPHAASIMLHEAFCDKNDRSPTSSVAKSLTSAKCVVNSTYLLYESSNDLSGCDPFLPFCWGVVGRALVRDFAVKSSWGEVESARMSRTLAEHCLGFTARCAKIRGTAIAKVLTSNLRGLLEDPELTFSDMQ